MLLFYSNLNSFSVAEISYTPRAIRHVFGIIGTSGLRVKAHGVEIAVTTSTVTPVALEVCFIFCPLIYAMGTYVNEYGHHGNFPSMKYPSVAGFLILSYSAYYYRITSLKLVDDAFFGK